mmetsp:Transcript_19833/g.30456  ORF Transcript_19833/g.30456 Transcript_19833/m.30456 type:complete len:933 (+) Transcript_19833:138-2936(+)
MDFDQNRIYFSHQNLASQQQAQDGEDDTATGLSDPFDITDGGSAVNMNAVRRHLREFLRNYRINTNRYIYRDKLINAHRRGRRSIEVDLGHVSEYDTALLGLLLRRPADTLPVFEAAALDCLRTTLYTMRGTDGDADDNEQQQNQQNQQTDAQGTTTIHAAHNQDDDNANTDNTNNDNNPNSIQILLTGNTNPTDLRQITARHMNRLVQCPGIVISAARIRSRARLVRIRCTRCQDSRTLTIAGSYSGATLPLQCMGSEPQECKQCPYEIVPDECVYVDQQTLKLQEAPELVPTGEMPRTILVSAERALVDVAPPGTRVHVMGIVSLFTNSNNSSSKSSSNSSSKQVYLRAVGMSKNANANGGGNTSTTTSFTPAEQEAFRELSRVPFEQLYQIMTHSIAPSISGSYTLDLKRAMACQLFGGSFKQLPESNHMRLRGDINVLLMGDPSTAKSQFLKFIERVAPVGVYTSGKGSSAAGLTASVVRDSRGEFYLEGGAMVLADGGIVCIDEFDKMRPQDRVAIHEAMEQQTISITKAGIQATLNARASILAAANPIYGRYDRSKTLKANIAVSAPILSRFDLFFVVLDECDELTDYNVAKHIIDVHRCKEGAVEAPFTKSQLQLYIRYAKTINPKIIPESQKVLVECYRTLRQGDTLGRSRSAYRITVRQLESMIRLSEALARLYLDEEVKPVYVREAFRLLKKSIIHVETEDVVFDDDEDDEEDDDDNLAAAPDADDEERATAAVSDDENKAQKQEQQRRRRVHPGEYRGEEEDEPDSNELEEDVDDNDVVKPKDPDSTLPAIKKEKKQVKKSKKKKKKKKKQKTQITFEQYQTISNAISTYLRSIEDRANSTEEQELNAYITRGEAVQWYLEQCEGDIGDSEEELERMTKLVNLVVQRLIVQDRVLVYIGDISENDPVEKRLIAVHPNFVSN